MHDCESLQQRAVSGAFIIERFSGGEIGVCVAARENRASLRLAGRAKAPVHTRAHFIEDSYCAQSDLTFQLKTKS
jgi:hypothetical protein